MLAAAPSQEYVQPVHRCIEGAAMSAQTPNGEMHSAAPSREDHAVAHARAGWFVFPGRDDTGGKESKHPRIGKWQRHATRDEATIREWWKRWPNANICGFTGKFGQDGGALIVVDLDPKDGGIESFKKRKAEDERRFSDTRVHDTPSGVKHVIYSAPQAVRSPVRLWEGIDIRSADAYVLLPGSTIGGVPYKVATE